MPCAKLNGRIQMRILAVRHANAAAQPSMVSRGMRSAAENVGLWSQKAADLDASLSRDVALIKAYNRRLSELGCPTFDVNADLAKSDTADLPRPRRTQVNRHWYCDNAQFHGPGNRALDRPLIQ